MNSDENQAELNMSADSDINRKSRRSSLRAWVTRHLAITLTCILITSGLLFAYHPILGILRDRSDADFKHRCKIAAMTSDWTTLDSLSSRWMASNPESNDAVVFAAEAAVQLDELERSVELLDQVDNEYEGALQALAIRADILFSDLNRPLDAEATWQRILQIEESADVAHQRLIYYYAMTLQRQKMLKHIYRTMELGRESLESYSYLVMANSLNFSDGLRKLTLWRRAAANDESLEVAQAVYAAKKTADNGIATFGIQTIAPGDKTLLDNCLKKYPSNPEVLALKIEFAIFEGKTNDVIRLMTQASGSAEKDSRFWRYRGWLLAQQNLHEESAEALTHALKLNPFEWQARLLLADVYRKLGNSELTTFHAQLASQGKNLQEKIFERPTAKDIDEPLFREIHDYCRKMDASTVVEAIERRL